MGSRGVCKWLLLQRHHRKQKVPKVTRHWARRDREANPQSLEGELGVLTLTVGKLYIDQVMEGCSREKEKPVKGAGNP